MEKLNAIAVESKIVAYGFSALLWYASACSKKDGDSVIVSSLSPAVMAEQGITEYYAPVLPRGTVYRTESEVWAADLDCNLIRVSSVPMESLPKRRVIVSRHAGTLALLQSKYPDATVLSGNVAPADIAGALVIGTLPPHLVAACAAYIAVTIDHFDYKIDGDLSGEALQERLHISAPISVSVGPGKKPKQKVIDSLGRVAEMSEDEFNAARSHIFAPSKSCQSVAISTSNQIAATNWGYQSAAINMCDFGKTQNDGRLSVSISAGDGSVAHNNGVYGTAEATGDQSEAVSTGGWGAAITMGDRSKAVSTEEKSVAISMGVQSASMVNGPKSLAIVTGRKGKAAGALGCWLVLVEYDHITLDMLSVQVVKVDGKTIKPDTYYTLLNGKATAVDD